MKFKKLISLLLAILLAASLAACSNDTGETTTEAVETTAPSTEADTESSATPTAFEWQKDNPENHNISADFLSALHSDFDSTEIQSVVITKDDYIVDEYYKYGYDASTVFPLYSVSKSITSALVGIAIEQGYIESVDTPISQYFPQIGENGSDYQKEITVWHLLTHTSGIDMSDDYNWDEWIASDNWVNYILNRSVTSKPGTVFSYNTGNSHLLCAILEQATGMSLLEYGQKNLFEPLGIDSVECSTDPQGISDGGNGFEMNIYDMLKIGRLYLNNGNWEGEQIVPEQWIKDTTSVQFDRNSGSADYGYQWWVRQFNGHDAFFAQGHYGQFIFVVPDCNLIVAFTSHNTGTTEKYWNFMTRITMECQ